MVQLSAPEAARHYIILENRAEVREGKERKRKEKRKGKKEEKRKGRGKKKAEERKEKGRGASPIYIVSFEFIRTLILQSGIPI